MRTYYKQLVKFASEQLVHEYRVWETEIQNAERLGLSVDLIRLLMRNPDRLMQVDESENAGQWERLTE